MPGASFVARDGGDASAAAASTAAAKLTAMIPLRIVIIIFFGTMASSMILLVALAHGTAIQPRGSGPRASGGASVLGGRAVRTHHAGEAQPYVIEVQRTSDLVSAWSLNDDVLDPFGLVLWPAATVIADELGQPALPCADRTFMEVGCGTGLVSLTAAARGASRVIATDNNPAPLELVDRAAQAQGLDAVETAVFDLCGAEELPAVDCLLAADVCYNEQVARALARRCAEAHERNIQVLVVDSVNIARRTLVEELKTLGLPFEERHQDRVFRGHAVSMDEDVERRVSVALFSLQ